MERHLMSWSGCLLWITRQRRWTRPFKKLGDKPAGLSLRALMQGAQRSESGPLAVQYCVVSNALNVLSAAPVSMQQLLLAYSE